MSRRPSWGIILGVTSSPASVVGTWRCRWRVGRWTFRSGPARAHASRLVRRVSIRGLRMTDTCGLPGSSSSPNAALQSSLASRLRVLMDSAGSTLFALTWKERITPSGRRICARRASVRRTSDNGCGSWPSPVVNAATGSQYAYSRGDHDKRVLKLPGVAKLASWPTPCQQDGPKGGPGQGSDRLPGAAGLTAIGFPAATGSPGQLNPDHSRWLMGYPIGWANCAPTGTRSSRK